MSASRLCYLRKLRHLPLSAWLLCAGEVGHTSEYWVSTAGDDGAGGGQGTPFRTIQRGVEAAAPGDTVWVRAGRYEECVSIPQEKSGAPGRWLTISAAPGAERQAVVGTETPRVDAYGSASSAFSLREVQFVRVHGFYCVAPYRGRGSAIGAGKSQHIEVLNCVANCWQINQQEDAHEITVRGARSTVRNNIGVSLLPKGVGMLVLPSYSTGKGRVDIDPKTILCDQWSTFETFSNTTGRIQRSCRATNCPQCAARIVAIR